VEQGKYDEVLFRFPAKTEYLGWIHVLFGRLADDFGFDRARKNRLLVAVTEAFTNAVVHGRGTNNRMPVTVVVKTKPREVIVEVIDNGAGLVAIPPGSTWTGPDWKRESGRGLALMRALSDDLVLRETPGGGLTVAMHYRTAEPSRNRRQTLNRHDTAAHKGGNMELQMETQGGVNIIHVAGRLDLVGANALKDEVRRILQDPNPQLVLDLKKVDFINSSGLGALVSVLKDVRLVGGRLVLSDLAPYVREIFTITQLSNVFEIYPTEQEARQTFEKPVPA